MIDGNTVALNKHLAEQDKIENSFERLCDQYLNDIATEIEDLIDTAKKLGKNWENIDFEKDAEDLVKGSL